MSDTRSQPGVLSDFGNSDLYDEPLAPPDSKPTPDQPTESDTKPPGETVESAHTEKKSRVFIVILGLMMVFVPAAMSLTLNFTKVLLILPATIVIIVLSSYWLVRTSIKLDEDSPFAASSGIRLILNRIGNVTGRHFTYITEADLARQVKSQTDREIQADLDEYERLLFHEIKKFNHGRSVVVTVVNVKGGAAKTPISAMIAIFLGMITRRVLTAIDFNPFAGNLAKWMGITPGLVRMRELVFKIKANDGKLDFNQFGEGLSENDYNNQLVPSNITAERESLTIEVVELVMGNAISNSNHVVNDTSNNIGAPALSKILDGTDVTIVAGLCREDKLDGVVETLANFSAWGWNERVRHAVVTLAALEPGRTVESYRKELDLGDDVIITAIPHDTSLERFRGIHPRKLMQETRIGIMETVLIASKVAAHTKQDKRKGWQEPALSFTLGKLVPLSSGRTPVLSYLEPQQAA